MRWPIKIVEVKKIFFAIILCCFFLPFFSQNKKIDSLLKIAGKHLNDTIGAKAYLRISTLYLGRGIVDSGYTYANKGYLISQKLKFYPVLGLACNNFGQVYNYRGNLDSAIYYFTKAKEYYVILSDSALVGGMLNNIGVVYRSHGNISTALDYYFKALKIKERLHDTIAIANSYSNIGHLFSEANDTSNTIKYHRMALALRTKVNDLNGIGNSLMAIGLYYQGNEQLDQALLYLQKGLAISEKVGDEEAIAIGCYNVGAVYYKQHKIEKCLPLYERALGISKKNNNYEGIATCLEIIGQISFEKKEIKEAVKMLEEAFSVAKNIDNKELISSIANKLSYVYEKTGDYKKSLTYHKIWVSVKDSLFDQENTRKLTSESLKYEHEKEKIILQKEQEKKEAIIKSETFKKDLILGASVLFLLIVSVFTFIIFKRLKENRKQKDIIETQRNEMIDSINYAKRIQFALLAHTDLLSANLPQHFILFNPKDIVSGDFYWAIKKDDHFYLAVCDSTGHGVPGAFMSLLNISFLNEAINEKNISAPNKVLDHVRKRLLENMDGGRDGMDAVLLKIPVNKTNLKVEYAAANNSPVLIRNDAVIELAKDKMPVGKGEVMDNFKLHEIDLQKEDTLYLYTDGFADQFGGPKGKKFKYKQLNQLLLANCDTPMTAQKEILNSTIQKWKGDLEQVDDICVIGIKI
ncbi:MAG: tetratricopeptide repeat protein [Bacteroidetes bacterium]|nr:tetratricopeptide repeat protein [Bacteroidota bacterium]